MIFLVALAWILGFLEFHLPIRGISPLFVFVGALVLYFLIGVNIFSDSYMFSAEQVESPNVPLEAENDYYESVLKTTNNGNLVVVAVSGGGILSASWSTYWLYQLLSARPELACEIRLFSTVSGGTVGMANYLMALKQEETTLSCDENGREIYTKLAKEAYDRATQSSISAVTYGMAYSDLWRATTGGLVTRLGLLNKFVDRGNRLENAWREEATENPNPSEDFEVSAFADPIMSGEIPAFIFNSTILETGERMMITPLGFNGTRKRARTISEVLTGEKNEIDMDLFTAARLSATFSYVSPAATTNIDCESKPKSCGYHFLDGGYHDNFGIQSGLDFLRIVLNKDSSQPKEERKIKRVLIIEMRLTNFKSENKIQSPETAFNADLYGPMKGFYNSAFSGQLSRNEIALDNFIKDWEGEIPIEVLTIQPTEDVNGPLSWHLPTSQQRKLFPIKEPLPTDESPNDTEENKKCPKSSVENPTTENLITYCYGQMPRVVEEKVSCDDTKKLEDCSLKDVFETWKMPFAFSCVSFEQICSARLLTSDESDKQNFDDSKINTDKKAAEYIYLDCFQIMTWYLDGQLDKVIPWKNDEIRYSEYPEACKTR